MISANSVYASCSRAGGARQFNPLSFERQHGIVQCMRGVFKLFPSTPSQRLVSVCLTSYWVSRLESFVMDLASWTCAYKFYKTLRTMEFHDILLISNPLVPCARQWIVPSEQHLPSYWNVSIYRYRLNPSYRTQDVRSHWENLQICSLSQEDTNSPHNSSTDELSPFDIFIHTMRRVDVSRTSKAKMWTMMIV